MSFIFSNVRNYVIIEKLKKFCISIRNCDIDNANVIRKSFNSTIDNFYINQFVTTTIQIEIMFLFKSWNIVSTKIIEYFFDEFAITYIINALSFQLCLFIVYHRKRLISKFKKNENDNDEIILIVNALFAKINIMFKKLNCNKISITCINKSFFVIIFDDELIIQIMKKHTKFENLFVQKLHVDVTYHFYHMKIIANKYLKIFEKIKTCFESKNVFYFLFRNQIIDQKSLNWMYWINHLINFVQFSYVVENMCYDFREKKNTFKWFSSRLNFISVWKLQ